MTYIIINRGSHPYLFWSVEDGWVNPNASSVTIFSEGEEPDTVPDDGEWIDTGDAWMYL